MKTEETRDFGPKQRGDERRFAKLEFLLNNGHVRQTVDLHEFSPKEMSTILTTLYFFGVSLILAEHITCKL